MKTFMSCLVLLTVLVSVPQVHAAFSPLSVSLAPPAQFPPSDFSITGARVSALWGRHRDIWGLDLGLVGNITEQTFVGAALAGGFNMTHGNTTILGLQLAGIANINTNKTWVYGVQAALLNTNSAETKISGLQLALANLSGHTTVYGAQLGVFNKARSVYGVQIGVVNVTENLHGIQIGLLNYNRTGFFVVSPLLNVGF